MDRASELWGSLSTPLPQNDLADQIMPRPRNPAAPADWAQNLVRSTGGKLADLVMAPRRAMDQGMTTEEAVPWAGDMAMNMAGAGGLGAAPGTLGAAGGKLMQPEGIRAYHGSPHDFERFDISKIGTGEGAQSYGHGLYFAENPATAGDYKKRLSSPHNVAEELIRSASGDLPLTPEHVMAIKSAASDTTPILEAAKRLQWRFPDLRDADQVAGSGGPLHRGIAASIEQARNAGKGHMYEVNINAKPEQFLDWDKPLSAQAPQVQESLKGARSIVDRGIEKITRADPTGQYLYSQIGRADPQASAALREAGVPGIKYLDQGSRHPGFSSLTPAQLDTRIEILRSDIANGGGNQQRMREQLTSMERDRDTYRNQTSNYVLFEDKLIDIIRKYGLAGAAPVAGASSFGSRTPKEQ